MKILTTSLLTALSALLAFAASDVHRLTLNDLVSVEPIGETKLSPDGKIFAFVRGAQIVIMPAAGGWPTSLTSSTGGKNGLSWSPDSGALAYVSQGSIWTVSANGGTPKRLTHTLPGSGDPRQSGDRNPQWSPKGDWILFESGRRGHGDLLTVTPDGMSENIITASAADSGEAAWSHDSSEIAWVERAPGYFSGKLQVAKFDSQTGRLKAPSTLYTSPVDRGGGWSLRSPVWSPDGKMLAVVLQTAGWDNIYLLPASGGDPKPLTQGEQDDLHPTFSPDGKSVAFTSNREKPEESRIWIASVKGGESAHPLAAFKVPGVESDPEWSEDGKEIYFHRTSALTASDLLVAKAAGGAEPRYLTDTTPKNIAASLEVPDRVHFKSKDGVQITGLLYKPASFKTGTRYPAVLWIHGGPEAQDVYRLDLWAQFLAQQGFLVLEPNYRGGTGYGEKFRNLNVEDSGGGEVDDIAAGVQYLVDQSLADAKRIAIGGGSHGGTMTAYAVTRYPQLFAAAIEMFGVVDRATFVERTNRNSAVRWMMKMGGSPAEKPDVYKRANCLLLVDKIQTPLLILHGEDDPQVPPYESVQFTKALAAHHKTFYYFTYPGELHGFSQREHRLDAWAKELAFLRAYIDPKFGQSSTSTDPFLLTGPTSVANEHPAH